MTKSELLLVEAALNGWIVESNGRIQLTAAGRRVLSEQVVPPNEKILPHPDTEASNYEQNFREQIETCIEDGCEPAVLISLIRYLLGEQAGLAPIAQEEGLPDTFPEPTRNCEWDGSCSDVPQQPPGSGPGQWFPRGTYERWIEDPSPEFKLGRSWHFFDGKWRVKIIGHHRPFGY